MQASLELTAILALASLLPLFIAVGTCYMKLSIVFVLVRNAIGLQNVPSNLTLNGIALLLSLFVMMPLAEGVYHYLNEHPIDFSDRESLDRFTSQGLAGYRRYLSQHARPALVTYFEGLRYQNEQAWGDVGSGASGSAGARTEKTGPAPESASAPQSVDPDSVSLMSLLPAYSLSEIEDAFRIGFYLYLPFVVIDLVVSSILLALGMMMMSPVTISIPIKLLLFIAMDGWGLLSRGLIEQYIAHP